MNNKFRPIKTTEIRCKQCGHKGKIEVDEKELNTTIVNYVQKIRHSERETIESLLAAKDARVAELEKALKMLHDETVSYVEINHLGDPWHNQSMKLAKQALNGAEDKK